MLTHDPVGAALEIREQLASEKRRLAFFLGAGTSMAAGLPGINSLTEEVTKYLKEPFKKQFESLIKKVGKNPNVEKVLNKIRIYRELLTEDKDKIDGLDGKSAKELDIAVCKAIANIVSKVPKERLNSHIIFAQWLRMLQYNRHCPVEIYTTNYDLLLEQAMEDVEVPYFDGFIGSVAPFFILESVEAENNNLDDCAKPPRIWTRLWKLHGSINWQMKKNNTNERERITRLSNIEISSGDELMIFPSREKYAQSRKLPFIALQDRFRKFVSSGENLVIVLGYSFSDEHLNDVMLQGLRSNPRLAITAFMHDELDDNVIKYASEHRNLSLYGPDKTYIGGKLTPWGVPTNDNESMPFWDKEGKNFKLGDFTSFALFLSSFMNVYPQSSEVKP